jgi:ribosomal protein S18 acetylase RimI-like enzyme
MEIRAPAGHIIFCEAASELELAHIRSLFLEYAASLEISLCFQNFEQELAGLPGKYARPTGRLILARDAQQAAGCVALRKLDDGICEMKRLFVRPAWRRKGLGSALVEQILSHARQIGYRSMRLDTLASLTPAISLYESFGFRQIPAYYENPSEKAVFMELELSSSKHGSY